METPGRYTGNFGDCDTSLQFVTEPVQTRKVCVPNYSAEMKKLMCDKMNELYDAGILAFPEELQRYVHFTVNFSSKKHQRTKICVRSDRVE